MNCNWRLRGASAKVQIFDEYMSKRKFPTAGVSMIRMGDTFARRGLDRQSATVRSAKGDIEPVVSARQNMLLAFFSGLCDE